MDRIATIRTTRTVTVVIARIALAAIVEVLVVAAAVDVEASAAELRVDQPRARVIGSARGKGAQIDPTHSLT